MDVVFWSLVGFFMGSIPFAILTGRFIAGKDIRKVGDGNPGGTNALKAGGLKAGLPAILLDMAKGFLPVYFAKKYGLIGWGLIPVAFSPVLGHAFSPFLRFHGGKALGATAGAWVALIGLLVFPIYGSLAIPFTIIQSEDSWSACAGMLALVGYAMIAREPWLVLLAVTNTLVILWTHRHDLVHGPRLRQWVTKMLTWRSA